MQKTLNSLMNYLYLHIVDMSVSGQIDQETSAKYYQMFGLIQVNMNKCIYDLQNGEEVDQIKPKRTYHRRTKAQILADKQKEEELAKQNDENKNYMFDKEDNVIRIGTNKE